MGTCVIGQGKVGEVGGKETFLADVEMLQKTALF